MVVGKVLKIAQKFLLDNKIIILLVLVIQNILIFYKHYFLGYGIPWDFMHTYLALPYYWIEASRLGVDISWTPFQGMGYPFHMQLQSGFYYLPNWLFVVFNKSYTITSAIIFQDIHVLFGAIGAVFASRFFNLSWKEALLVGVLYQGFGGFYSNASHIDIVRAYAYTPWILGPILGSWSPLNKYLLPSILVLPLWTYLLWTGGYIGISIAVSFTLGIVLIVRIFTETTHRKTGLTILFSLVIGMLLVAVAYLPPLLQMNEINRTNEILSYDYLQWIDLYSLIYPIDYPDLPHNKTMRLGSIGIIAFILLLSGISKILDWNRWLLLTLLLSILMASGILHNILIAYIPPLGFSRFTLSDYKGLLGLVLLLLSIKSFQSISYKINIRFLTIFVLLFIIFGYIFLGLHEYKYIKDVLFLLLIVSLVLITLFFAHKDRKQIVLFALLILAFADWYRIHGYKAYFNTPGTTGHIERRFGSYLKTQIKLHHTLKNPPIKRPSRIDIKDLKTRIKGYYTGQYIMRDYRGPELFIRYIDILETSNLYNFAMSEWKAVTLNNTEHIPESDEQIKMNNINTLSYGTSKIIYSVYLDSNTSIVENEIYWKGWQMDFVNSLGNNITLRPFDVDGFRGWVLPAGRYKMVATYHVPNQKISILISFIGIVLWLILIFLSTNILNTWKRKNK